mmetsp:Transcript_40405/g.94574  ORF Transcript_40405/g.94574 Transcript_40405/m.94574 type:complete len:205 (+) Transcript_40405:861-1475(+)
MSRGQNHETMIPACVNSNSIADVTHLHRNCVPGRRSNAELAILIPANGHCDPCGENEQGMPRGSTNGNNIVEETNYRSGNIIGIIIGPVDQVSTITLPATLDGPVCQQEHRPLISIRNLDHCGVDAQIGQGEHIDTVQQCGSSGAKVVWTSTEHLAVLRYQQRTVVASCHLSACRRHNCSTSTCRTTSVGCATLVQIAARCSQA